MILNHTSLSLGHPKVPLSLFLLRTCLNFFWVTLRSRHHQWNCNRHHVNNRNNYSKPVLSQSTHFYYWRSLYVIYKNNYNCEPQIFGKHDSTSSSEDRYMKKNKCSVYISFIIPVYYYVKKNISPCFYNVIIHKLCYVSIGEWRLLDINSCCQNKFLI